MPIASGGSEKNRDHFARLHISPVPQEYYLKVRSNTGLITQPSVFTWQAYLDRTRAVTIWLGLFYGIIVAVAVYNFFLFISLGDRSYLWYVLHLLFLAFYFLGINGLTNMYILPGRPEFVGMLNRAFLGMMMVFIALLTRSFFMSRARAPRLDRAMLAAFFAASFLVVINFVVPARFVNTLMTATGILVPAAVVLAALGELRSGFIPARLFLAAWGLFVIGVLFFSLTVGGVLPFTWTGFYGFQIGGVIAAVLLSLPWVTASHATPGTHIIQTQHRTGHSHSGIY